MTILQENSTHKAVKENYQISIYLKGLDKNALDENGQKEFDEESITNYPHWFKSEFLYSIPYEDKDCLFDIFERLDENNRINVAEATSEMKLNSYNHV